MIPSSIEIQATSEPRRKSRPCLEHLQISPWFLEAQPLSGFGLCIDCTLFCIFGATQLVAKTGLIIRTAVVRDPYARWCGREGP